MCKSLGILFLLVHFTTCKVKVIPLSSPDTNFIAGPVWDTPTQSVYAVDFVSPTGVNSIYRYDAKTGKIYGAQIIGESSPSFIWPVKGCDNEFAVGFLGNIKIIHWDGISSTATVVRTLFTAYGHFNYALADPKGRLYFGTLNNTIFCSSEPDYATYRYDDGTITTIFSHIKMTTGLAINPKRKKFYHGDACRYQILEFDYDCKTGDICNGRVIYDFKNSGLIPYPLILGINVDRKGLVYCTLYESSQMWIIDPRTSTVVNKIHFPSKGVSDIVFGGPHFDHVYVTSTQIIVDAYGGRLLEDRSHDATFFKVEGLNARGFDTSRVHLNDLNHNICHKKKIIL